MGATLGFGFMTVIPGNFSKSEAEKMLLDLATLKLSSGFFEVSYKEGTTTPENIYKIEVKGENVEINKLGLTDNPTILNEWESVNHYMDMDDWDIIFESANLFLPNSTLEEGFDYFEIEGFDEKKILSLECGINRINNQKDEYLNDDELPEDELNDLIETLDGYLNVFETAVKNGFTVSISY